MTSVVQRQAFLGALAGGLLPEPLAAEAQQARKVPRVGPISPGSPSLLARGDEVIQSPTAAPGSCS